MTLDKYLADLMDPKGAITAAAVARLSGLLPEELQQLKECWDRITPAHRLEIVKRMAEMADDSVEMDFHAVLCHATNDVDAAVRVRAVNGLWESDDRRAIPKLIARLVEDPEATVRAAAAVVLGRFAMMAAHGKLLDRDGGRVYRALLSALSDEGQPLEVRRRALESMGVFIADEVGDWIRWGYQSPEPKLRQSSVFAMGRSCDGAWLPVIIKEMYSEDPAMRYEAANASRELGEEESVPHLATLMQDDQDVQVQLAAIEALGAIGGGPAKKLLRDCAKAADDDTLKDAAEEALQMIDLEEGGLSFDRPTL